MNDEPSSDAAPLPERNVKTSRRPLVRRVAIGAFWILLFTAVGTWRMRVTRTPTSRVAVSESRSRFAERLAQPSISSVERDLGSVRSAQGKAPVPSTAVEDPGEVWDMLAEQWEREAPNPDSAEYLTTYFGNSQPSGVGTDLLRTIACHGKICRVELDFRERDRLLQSQQNLQRDGFGVRYQVLQNDGGAPMVVAFVKVVNE